VDILNFLENSGVSNGMPFLGSPLLGGFMMPARPPEVTALLEKGGVASPELQRYAQDKGIHYWNCSLKFYGPAKAIRAQWEYAQEQFSKVPGAKFQDGEFYKLPLTPDQFDKVHKPEFGIPSLETFSIGARSPVNPTPTSGHVWFSPIIPRTGEAVLEANRVFSQAAKDLGLPFLSFALPTTYWIRAFIFLFGFPITHDVATNRKNRESFKKMIQIAAEHGWGEYRTPPAFQDEVMATYSFNNHALRRFHETVKDAVDPNGILSAGRYGIWPKHLRGRKA
jgi:4-cresol dehydrogenase (hydroxylating)